MYFPILSVRTLQLGAVSRRNPVLDNVDEHWIHGRMEHRMSPFLDVLATRNQSRLDDPMRIVGASNMVGVLGEVAEHKTLSCNVGLMCFPPEWA